MSDQGRSDASFLKSEIVQSIGPQVILLLFPALCAFAIIIAGESLIVSDLAFIFGAILVIEAIYFTFWGLNSGSKRDNEVDRAGVRDGDNKSLEIRLECPQCDKTFFIAYLKKDMREEFECTHCSHIGRINGLDSVFEN